jgi:hypothetical protein
MTRIYLDWSTQLPSQCRSSNSQNWNLSGSNFVPSPPSCGDMGLNVSLLFFELRIYCPLGRTLCQEICIDVSTNIIVRSSFAVFKLNIGWDKISAWVVFWDGVVWRVRFTRPSRCQSFGASIHSIYVRLSSLSCFSGFVVLPPPTIRSPLDFVTMDQNHPGPWRPNRSALTATHIAPLLHLLNFVIFGEFGFSIPLYSSAGCFALSAHMSCMYLATIDQGICIVSFSQRHFCAFSFLT